MNAIEELKNRIIQNWVPSEDEEGVSLDPMLISIIAQAIMSLIQNCWKTPVNSQPNELAATSDQLKEAGPVTIGLKMNLRKEYKSDYGKDWKRQWQRTGKSSLATARKTASTATKSEVSTLRAEARSLGIHFESPDIDD